MARNGYLKTVSEVIDAYLPHAKREISPVNYHNTEVQLREFELRFGKKRVSDCRTFDLLEWINSHKGWKSDWMRYNAAVNVKKAFNWCTMMDLLDKNPFGKLRMRRGGRNRPIKPE